MLLQVQEGNRLEISFKIGTHKKVYASKVEEILDNNQLIIDAPISYGVMVKLPMNKTFDFVFFTETGMYLCTGVAQKHIKRDNIDMFTVQVTSTLEKIQRRAFFRFRCLIPFKFSKIDTNEISNESEVMDLEEGIIKDISGAGIRFVSNDIIQSHDMVQCIISLNQTYVVLYAKILYVDPIIEEKYRYDYRGTFTNISKIDQEKIIQYIFDEQRKVLQKQRGPSPTNITKL